MRALAIALPFVFTSLHRTVAEEPARDFLNQLRTAGYLDTAITYLDRLDTLPGVDPDLLGAIELEKALIHVDQAVAARTSETRRQAFDDAEAALSRFTRKSDHPRMREARLLLARVQVVRADQMLAGSPDASARQEAKRLYVGAAKTNDAIAEEVRETLKQIGNEGSASRLAQLRAEFLRALRGGADLRFAAARTAVDPGKDEIVVLREAAERFSELNEKYGDYAPGATALVPLGQIQSLLGETGAAEESFIRMLEAGESPALRDAQFDATSGLIRLWIAGNPPRYDDAIRRGQAMLDSSRPDERGTSQFAELQTELAAAYAAKSDDESVRDGNAKRRALTNARQLLREVAKVPGTHRERAERLMVSLNMTTPAAESQVELPTLDEPPTDVADALAKAQAIYAAGEQAKQAIEILREDDSGSESIAAMRAEIDANRGVAIEILRRGLPLANSETDLETLQQAHQLYAFLLYSDGQYRDAAAVGEFASRVFVGTDPGLRGGLIALNALQKILTDAPDNVALVGQLQIVGEHLGTTWPDNPEAAAAKNVMVQLALQNGQFDQAKELIEELPDPVAAAAMRRVLGQLLWNESIQVRDTADDPNDDNQKESELLRQAAEELVAGLEGIPAALADGKAMQAALVLTKVYLRMGDIAAADAALSNDKYGPTVLISRIDPPSEAFKSDLYGTQLNVLVQRLTSADAANTAELLDQSARVMDQLQASVTGPDAEAKLLRIYLRLAGEIKSQLDATAAPQKSRLIDAFRLFLDRIAAQTDDPSTLKWIGQTLIDLAESSMQPGQIRAAGRARGLLESGVATLQTLIDEGQGSPAIEFQLAKALRTGGKYKAAIDRLEKLLLAKPTMLDAQVEAARAYEQWAGTAPPRIAGRVYTSALAGARPAKTGGNTIWGWGKISSLTAQQPQYRSVFFESRYHVAKCRFLAGKADKNEAVIAKAASDITQVAALYPDLGGGQQRARFDALLKTIQTELGQQPTGLPAAP